MNEPNPAHANLAFTQMLQEAFNREIALQIQKAALMEENAALKKRVAELEKPPVDATEKAASSGK